MHTYWVGLKREGKDRDNGVQNLHVIENNEFGIVVIRGKSDDSVMSIKSYKARKRKKRQSDNERIILGKPR